MGKRIACVIGLLFLSVGVWAEASAQSAAQGIGVGAYPLSAEVATLWIGHHPPGGDRQPLVVVYFIGQSGWHDREWLPEANIGSFPAYYKLASPAITLHAAVHPELDRVTVQQSDFDMSAANVFFVLNIHKGVLAQIVPLGHYTLRTTDEPASITVLRDHPDVLEQLNAHLARLHLEPRR